jgi:cytidylate kinase
MNKPSIITIDGPAASGKSTLGQRLAARLGYLYFDTGVMYRAVTALALQHDLDLADEQSITALARQARLEILPPSVDDGRQYTVLADDKDITWRLRAPEVERAVSRISCHQGVRKVLREQQRRIGLQGQIVMVGRDIGAVVMPDADLKIFLQAPPEERARRRLGDGAARGHSESYEEILADLCRRDELDRQNTYLADDARLLDTGTSTPEELVDTIVAWFADGGDLSRAQNVGS